MGEVTDDTPIQAADLLAVLTSGLEQANRDLLVRDALIRQLRRENGELKGQVMEALAQAAAKARPASKRPRG